MKNYQKIVKNGVSKILITIPKTLEDMKQLIIKLGGGARAPRAGKKIKKIQKTQNCKKF